MPQFNLNADLAEGCDSSKIGDDEGLLDIVQSANIACGFHGGDFNIMAQVMRAAKQRGVSIGAHPSFDDREGFGRRQMTLPEAEIENLIAYQLGAALGVANLIGGAITHVKPHGALSNMAALDYGLSGVIVRAIKSIDASQILLAPAASATAKAGQDAGLAVVEEFFADRAYLADGSLVPRSRPDAIISDSATPLARCLEMLKNGSVTAVDGSKICMQCQSICIHADTPSALTIAEHIKKGLVESGFKPVSLPELLI